MFKTSMTLWLTFIEPFYYIEEIYSIFSLIYGYIVVYIYFEIVFIDAATAVEHTLRSHTHFMSFYT